VEVNRISAQRTLLTKVPYFDSIDQLLDGRSQHDHKVPTLRDGLLTFKDDIARQQRNFHGIVAAFQHCRRTSDGGIQPKNYITALEKNAGNCTNLMVVPKAGVRCNDNL